jgi:hypothetical protein
MSRSGRFFGGVPVLFAASLLVVGMDAGPVQARPVPALAASSTVPPTKPPWQPVPPKVTVTQPAPKVVTPSTTPAAPLEATPNTNGSAPTPVIIDTDIFGSADDAGALAIANALQDNGNIKILGVVVNYPSKWGAPAASAINTYYGHSSIPVGSIHPTTSEVATPKDYAQYVAQHFPNQIAGNDGANAPDAVGLYRQLLAGAADHSVTIVGIGLETNLQNLMNSPADQYSGLGGKALIAQKVQSLTMMGGQFPNSPAGDPEYNWRADASAATQVVNEWPTSVQATFEGYEVGASVTTGAGLAKTPATNPVRVAYERMIGAGKSMSSWDSIAVYQAGMGLNGLFTNSPNGSVVVDSVGGDKWSKTVKTGQHYLVKSASDGAIGTELEKLTDQLPATTTPSDPVAAYYQKLGGANSFLGSPVGAEYAPTTGGKAQNYQNGAIYWSSATAAHVVHGAFLARYNQLGGPAGTLGYPLMDEAAVSDRIGQYIRFSRPGGAYMYWTSRTGAHVVYGAILAQYLRLGGPTSALGYPITDEYGVPGGRRNDFQHGWITWQRSNGVIRVGYTR